MDIGEIEQLLPCVVESVCGRLDGMIFAGRPICPVKGRNSGRVCWFFFENTCFLDVRDDLDHRTRLGNIALFQDDKFGLLAYVNGRADQAAVVEKWARVVLASDPDFEVVLGEWVRVMNDSAANLRWST